MKWLLLVAAAVLVAAFVRWERHYAQHHQPLVDLSLFRLRSYKTGSTIALLYSAGFTAIFFVLTLYLQNGLRYSATLTGLFITPFAQSADRDNGDARRREQVPGRVNRHQHRSGRRAVVHRVRPWHHRTRARRVRGDGITGGYPQKPRSRPGSAVRRWWLAPMVSGGFLDPGTEARCIGSRPRWRQARLMRARRLPGLPGTVPEGG